MMLCIDRGNSRLKWGVHGAGRWIASGTIDPTELGQLAAIARESQPRRILIANVAGSAAGAAIREALLPWSSVLHEVFTTPQACGVTNGYTQPTRLGVDRWCALIGARPRAGAQACLVVMAGTATTIDTLLPDGQFTGGLILPGLDLMRRALARDTAALPLASGEYSPHPRNTNDAIITGCLDAQAGAIERAFARLPDPARARCLLSGGAAPRIAPLLTIPHECVENLVLDGLGRLGESMAKGEAIDVVES
jgi:type III pantothenate kinase